jgi:hypothetical protein
MNEEEKRKYEAFQYWIQTNTEKGVTTIPDNLCLFVINLIKSLQKENEDLHREINQRIKLKIENEKIVDTQFIPIQKVKDKISERQFELQQEYKDFEDDAILTVLQELIEMKH